jgi:hypothetical protein
MNLFSNPFKNPVSGKVSAAFSAAGTFGLLAGGLISFIPALHNNIPTDAIPLIPPAVSAIAAAVAGWFAHHRPTVPEILQELSSASNLVSALGLKHSAPLLIPTGVSVTQEPVVVDPLASLQSSPTQSASAPEAPHQ